VVEAMGADSRALPAVLKADGGMSVKAKLLQLQADMLGVAGVRPRIAETTALGAAFAAGLAVGFFASLDEIRAQWAEGARFEPAMGEAERRRLIDAWRKAVTRTFDWA
jgi:glycerol kinase